MFKPLLKRPVHALLTAALLLALNPVQAKRPPTAAEQSTSALSRLKDAAAGNQANVVAQARAELLAKQAQLDADLAAIEAQLKSGKLPAALLSRHSAALSELQARRAELAGKIAAADIASYLRGVQKTTSQAALDPAKLPKPGQASRAPLLNVADFKALDNKAKALASSSSVGSASAAKALITPSSAELSATPEQPFTPALRAQALALGGDPVKIFAWVRDAIAFVPTFGAIQNADQVLASRRGNAADQANLLSALLKVSNVPARLVHGSIDLSSAQVQAWLGVSSIEAALDVLGQGGMPYQAQTAGGQISRVIVETIWVEAAVDFYPSRGAVNRLADRWLPLDAAFKGLTVTAGRVPGGSLVFDAAGLHASLLQGATSGSGWVGNLRLAELATRLGGYQAQWASAASDVNLSLGALWQSGAWGTFGYDSLPTTLPYVVKVTGNRYDRLPDSLRWKLSVKLYGSLADRAQGRPLIDQTLNLAEVTDVLVLDAPPASADDSAVIRASLPVAKPYVLSQVAAIPGYLVKVTPELRLGRQVLAIAASSLTLGTETPLEVNLIDPLRPAAASESRPRAGETQVLAVDGVGVAAQTLVNARANVAVLQDKLARGEAPSRLELLADPLALGAWSSLAANDYYTAQLARAGSLVWHRQPSLARLTLALSVADSFGIPLEVRYGGLRLDLDRDAMTVAGANAARFVTQSGQRASAYAHITLERLLDAGAANQGVSSVRALAIAAQAPQKLYTLTSATQANLSALTLSSEVRDDLTAALAAGKTALAHEQPITVGGYTGSGYGVIDNSGGPTAGAGYWKLTGGMTGALYPADGLPQWGLGWLDAAGFKNSLDPLYTAQRGLADVLVALTADPLQIRAKDLLGDATLTDHLAAAQVGQLVDGALIIAGAKIPTQTLSSNRAPQITSQPATLARIGATWRYAATAQDADGDSLTWQLRSGPSGAAVSSQGVVTFTPATTGRVSLTLEVSDGLASASQTINLDVQAAPLPLNVTLGVSPQLVEAGQPVVITAQAQGGSSPALTVTLDNSPLNLNSQGQATVTATVGLHRIRATVTEAGQSVIQDSYYATRDASDTSAPTVTLDAPLADAEVTAPTIVKGSVQDAKLVEWKLLLSPVGEARWSTLASGSQALPAGSTVGTLDPSLLQNGIYDVMLWALDQGGQQSSQVIQVIVKGNLKVGHFSVAFRDLEIDVAGIPVTVTRAYDTRRKDILGDFGYGWTVDYQNVKLQTNKAPGLSWEFVQSGLQLCLRPVGKHYVTVNLPDRTEQFDISFSPECALAGGSLAYTPVFTPRSGTKSELSVPGNPQLLGRSGMLVDADGVAWNPTQYQLRSQDGLIYELDAGFGVKAIRDPHGNQLSYSANGVVHSTGTAISFTRDAQGRITSITDPVGNLLKYAYTATSDLNTVTDRLNRVSSHRYDTQHRLLDYTDPRGVLALRNEYDAEGRLIAQYDAQGNKVAYTHDLNQRRETVKDRRGFATTFVYDDNGNITQKIDPLGNITRYTVDANGNELTVTDPNGVTVTKTYNNRDEVLTEANGLGQVVATHEYNPKLDNSNGTSPASHKLIKTIDARGKATTYNYTLNTGSLISIQQPGSTQPMNIGYDGQGNLASLSDPLGNATSYQYDSKGRPIQETDAAGTVTRHTLNDLGHRTATTVIRKLPDGSTQSATTTFVVNAEGQVTQTTDPLGNVSKTSYNALGKMASTTDVLNRVTQYVYDSQGNLTETGYPDGTREKTDYDADGKAIAQTDRQGRITRMEYDALGRLTKTLQPDGKYTITSYDAGGRTQQTFDAKGNPTTFGYDAANRQAQTTDALGATTQQEYDPAGNVIATRDARQVRITYQLDDANRRTATILPDGKQHSVSYDNGGRKTSETDANGKVTRFEYDSLGRLNAVVDAKNQRTTYGYDSLGNKVSQTDAEGRVTRWEYDLLNRMAKRILPLGQSESFTYDAVGRIASYTDFAGGVTRYSYDANDRVLSKTLADGTALAWTYSQAGRVASASRNNQTTRFSYDANDRLTRQDNPDGTFLAYAYDAAGNRTQVTTPSGATSYTFDAKNRLETITDASNKVTRYSYLPNDLKDTVTHPNGTQTQYSYDGNNRLTSVTTKKVSDGSVLTRFTYTLGDNGERKAVTDHTGRILGYEYDDLYRLTKETATENATVKRTTSYVYTATGNRQSMTVVDGSNTTTTTYSYDNNDRLTSSTTGSATTTYTWDNLGRLTQKTNASGTTKYIWSSDDRLTQVTLPTGTAVTYGYDGNGQRISQTVNGVATRFLIDGNRDYAQVLEERTNGTLTSSYLFGDKLLSVNQGAQSYTVAPDGQHSIRGLTNAQGQVTDQTVFQAFGETLSRTGTAAVSHGYTGEFRDNLTGLVYLRERWYDPETGRFVSRDDLNGENDEVPHTLNKLLYCNADPLNRRDPSGRGPLAEQAATAAMYAILVTAPVYFLARGMNYSLTHAEPPTPTPAPGTQVNNNMPDTYGTPPGDPCFLINCYPKDEKDPQKWNWANTESKAYGHSFLRSSGGHGAGRSAQSLADTARGTEIPQGQWLNNSQAAPHVRKAYFDAWSSPNSYINKGSLIYEYNIPAGLGRVYMPNGEIVSSERARIVIRLIDGKMKASFPIP